MRSRSFFIFIIAFFHFLFIPSIGISQDRYKAPEVVKGVDINVPIYRVNITGSPDLVDLAKRAFGTHGSYNIVPSSPQFTFDFQNAGSNAVTLTIKGSRSSSQTITGTSKSNALAKACDIAVEQTLGIPGYFAGKLVYVSDKTGKTEIYTSDMLFQNVKMLTNDKSDSMLPHWSPDGKKILYTGYFRTKLMDLYEINLDNYSRRVFASYRGSNTCGTFSPDGRKVALILTTSGNAEIWICDSNGKNLKRITKTPSVEASVSWSPDGRELVFTCDALGYPQIYKMSSSGGSMSRVLTNISRYCSEPRWNKTNPDLIAFTTAEGRGLQVAIYDFSQRKSEVITSGGRTSLPAWLNDGRHLVVTKQIGGGKRALYIVDSATKKQTLLHTSSQGSCGEADYIYIDHR